MGCDQPQRMSVRGRIPPTLPASPTPSFLPWGPLDTPPSSLHPKTPEVHSSGTNSTPRELQKASSRGAGKKIKHSPLQLGTASETPPSALAPRVSGPSFQGANRGDSFQELGRRDSRSLQPGTTQSKDCFDKCVSMATAWLTGVRVVGCCPSREADLHPGTQGWGSSEWGWRALPQGRNVREDFLPGGRASEVGL